MECEQIKENLDIYILGALETEINKEIETHLKSCSSCGEYLAETTQAFEKLRALPGIEPQTKYSERIIHSHRKRKKAFSFVMITMIGFAVLVFWLGLSVLQSHKQFPRYKISELEKGIWRYSNVNGSFPPQDTNLTEVLMTNKYGGPFISLDIFKINTYGYIVDNWGTPYIYRVPGKYNTRYFDIYSCGKNKKDEKGKGDDVKNWKDKTK